MSATESTAVTRVEETGTMKLGSFLPNWMPDRTDRRLMIDWARFADEAGFYLLGTLDRPNGDTWDPMTTLGGVATVTERIKLGPMILQLPNRNEVIVAKQAATVDRLSEGRFILGVGAGGRRDDFAVHDGRFSDRWRRFPGQVERIREVWRDSLESPLEDAFMGPPPVQEPGPPVWFAATLPETMRKSVELGDGLILSQGSDQLGGTKALISELREEATRLGKPDFKLGRVMFVAIGEDRAKVEAEAMEAVDRVYNVHAWTGIENMVTAGSAADIEEVTCELAEAGLDVFVYIPAIPDVGQLELLAETALRRFPSWSEQGV